MEYNIILIRHVAMLLDKINKMKKYERKKKDDDEKEENLNKKKSKRKRKKYTQ